jgi:hypothetical protein
MAVGTVTVEWKGWKLKLFVLGEVHCMLNSGAAVGAAVIKVGAGASAVWAAAWLVKTMAAIDAAAAIVTARSAAVPDLRVARSMVFLPAGRRKKPRYPRFADIYE